MIKILQNLVKYLETEDEKYLSDKYLKSDSFKLKNLLDKLNIPDFEVANIGEYKRGYNKGYLDGTLNVLKLWLENDTLLLKGKQDELLIKKDKDQEILNELKEE